MKNRRWTEEEITLLKSELKKGTTATTIANMLGVDVARVVNKKQHLQLKSENQSKKEWSEKECKVFCKIMAEHWTNISNASRLIALKTGRTPHQVMSKWYYLKNSNKLEEFFKTYYSKDFQMCFMSVGSNSHMVNTKVSTGESTIIKHKVSLWKKLFNLFK